MQDHLNRRAARRTPRICRRLLKLLLGVPFLTQPELYAADATIALLGSKVVDSRAMTLDTTIATFGDALNGISYQTPITMSAG